MDSELIPPSESEEGQGIKRRRLNEDVEETEAESSDSESLSPQDPETKSIIKKLAP
jgi:hypothetical protein